MRRAELVLHHNPPPRADVMLMKTVEEAHGPPSLKRERERKLSSLSLCRKRAKGGVKPKLLQEISPRSLEQSAKRLHLLKISLRKKMHHVAQKLQDSLFKKRDIKEQQRRRR